MTTAGTERQRLRHQTQTAFANDSAPLWNALGTVAPVDRAASQITAVGPSLGREYLTKALWALVIALGIQFLYIAFRFGWNYIFGLVTVIALVRDAAMMIGIYALADRRADDAFLAAVLTVIGYSVMDTIVILDRIRENTKLMAGAAVRDDRQRIDQADDDALVQHAGDGRHHARRAARARRRQLEELRVRAARRHLLGRLPLDLLLGAAGAQFPQAAARSGRRNADAPDWRSIAHRYRACALPNRRRSRAAAASRVKISSLRAANARQKAKSARTRCAGTAPRVSQEAATMRPAASRSRNRYAGDEDEAIDPLDAQNAGLHDAALEQGHEEITLNFDERRQTHDDAEQPHERNEGEQHALSALPPPTPSEAAFEARASRHSTRRALRATGPLRNALGERDAFVERVFAQRRRVSATIRIRPSATRRASTPSSPASRSKDAKT